MSVRFRFLIAASLVTAAASAQAPPVTPGFPNVAQSAGDLLSGLNAPEQGRTAIIAYHNGVLFTVPEVPSSQPGADFLVRTWDLTDPASPAILDVIDVTPMPINAHGYFKSGEYLVLGSNWPPTDPWSFRWTPTPMTVTRTEFPDLDGAGVRGQLFQPWYVGQTWWSYGDIEGLARISLRGTLLGEWDHLAMTGVIGHPFLLGDLLIFASDQSRTGVATYDVSDPASPVLLDVLTTGGPGGYWPELWGGDGKLYVVFPYRTAGNGIRVVDATDPTDLRFVADQPLPGAEAMYMQFQDEFAFTGGHKVDMRTFQSVLFLDGDNVTRTNDGGVGIDTSQFALPLGNLLVTGGIGPNEGMAIWAHQAAPDTRGPSVGFHVPAAGRTGYPTGAPVSLLIHETLETYTIINGETFIVRPLGGSAISGRLTFAFDDILTFTPDSPFAADTTYEVVIPAGGIKDAAGNGITGLTFTFSTGGSLGGNQPPVVDGLAVSTYPAAPLEVVTLSAGASDPEGEALEYRFDFGDGSPRSAWAAASTADHAYAAEGHYQPTVQVRDPAGAVASGAALVTVVNAPSGPRPARSTPVVCDPAARRVWTVNPDNDSVTAIDADALTVVTEVAVCDDPRSLARAAAGEIWIACHDDDRLFILDASGAFVDEIATGHGSAPTAVAMAPDGATAYVSLQGRGESYRRYDVAARTETASVALGRTPRALAVSADGSRVYVTRLLSAPDHAEVWVVDTASFAVSDTIRMAKFGFAENADTTASGRGVANYLVGIAISPRDDTAWVASNKPNFEKGLLFFDDLDQDNSVRNIVSQLDLGGATLTRAIDLDNSDSASAVAYSPLGDYLFVTLQGNGEVLVLDALRTDGTSGLGSLVTRLATGLAPQGVCVDPVTNRTFVKNLTNRTVTALETDALFRSGARAVGGSTAIATVASEAMPAEVVRGKQVFYDAGDPRMSAEGYLSCATCHLDGGHDGRTWDFTGRGEGMRNTTSLRGRAGTAHGNVHWSANFDEIQDFENDIRGAFGGSGFLTDADFAATSAPLGPAKAGRASDLDALAAYVASLQAVPRSPYRNLDGSPTAEAVAGEAVFESTGCAGCHVAPRYTDSTLGTASLHDVGTLRTTSGGRLGGALAGIDTPTLFGLWNTAPYFHDGSAATLDDVFTVAGGEVLQAEDGTISGGATLVDQWVYINNDDTVKGRAYVNVDGGRLTFDNVDGGPGGTGALELRYSWAWPTSIDVIVNGVVRNLTPTLSPNEPMWRQTIWLRLRIEDVALDPGPTNTIEIANGNLGVDEIVVSTAADLATAGPHRRVQALAATDRAALTAFLLQLDGSDQVEAGHCSDGIDNDLDGFVDCLDSDCAGSAGCPGIAVNRSIALLPRPTPAVATVFSPGCRVGAWTLCPDEWQLSPGPELRLSGEAAPGSPALWLYEQSEATLLQLTKAERVLVW